MCCIWTGRLALHTPHRDLEAHFKLRWPGLSVCTCCIKVSPDILVEDEAKLQSGVAVQVQKYERLVTLGC